MQNYKLRMVIEKAELEIKINDLNDFIDSSPVFDGLTGYEQDQMQQQVDTMRNYRDILDSRI